jgi:16S rRNA (guanine1207-N2)-methyltransferase
LSKQYFENNDLLASNEQIITYYYKQFIIELFSDAGVFSVKQVDFGTNLLIKNVILPENCTKILDVGCGYGPIGITLAKANPKVYVHMIDVNLRAIDLAKRNAEHNNLKNAEIWESDLYTTVEGKYDLIISNPPIRAGKKVVHGVFEGAINYLKPYGELWIVIQKKQGAPSAYSKLTSVFDHVEIIAKEKGYWIIKAKHNGENKNGQV